jgi:hypothetical protein
VNHPLKLGTKTGPKRLSGRQMGNSKLAGKSQTQVPDFNSRSRWSFARGWVSLARWQPDPSAQVVRI